MNERDEELATECYVTPSWEFDYKKFAELIRADERESLEGEDWTVILREGSLVTWGDAEELGHRVRAVIRARGNT